MRIQSAMVALVACTALASCVDTDRVYVERNLFEDPPLASQGFLGYRSSDSQEPVCGNCHVGRTQQWHETAHADAWSGLEGSGFSETMCEGCHTVGSLGNAVEDVNVGWTGTGDSRYHDVQCESCHGPGLDHVTDPDATQPLASILATPTIACGECHQGSHSPFVEEWQQSRHFRMSASPQANASCVGCHEARGIFREWGLNLDYLEEGQTQAIPITCAVCHDPHSAENAGQLRFPIEVRSVEDNLCMRCHHKRGVPDTTTYRGPHSPQGPLLLGEAGWRPADFEFGDDPIIATHGSQANEHLCATCHMGQADVSDPVTGDFVFHSTGHTFRAIPCLDAQGIPTTEDDCTLSQRSFAACATGGCHGSPEAARSAVMVVRERIENLTTALRAQLAQVPATEFIVGDVYTTAEGARFNAELGEMDGSPIHNPFLIEALLLTSIDHIETQYGIAPTPALSRQPQLDDPR